MAAITPRLSTLPTPPSAPRALRIATAPLLCIALINAGCDAETSPESATPSATASATNAASKTLSRDLAVLPAFDLVSDHGEGVLVWADRDRVAALRMRRDGTVTRENTIAKASGVLEVAAAMGNGLGVAWMAANESKRASESGEIEATLIGTVGDATTLEAPEPARIAAAATTISERRGRLAMAARPDGQLSVFAQGPRERCEDRDGDDVPMCSTFGTHKLPADGSETRRPRLTVPHPCPVPIAGFTVTPHHWHYAVCNIEERGNTTVLFTAQPDPSYAQVVRVLHGCSPSGAARMGDSLWLTSNCGGSAGIRAAVTAEGVDVVEQPHDLARAKLLCNKDNTLELSPGGWREPVKQATLATATGIAAVLPRSMAPSGSRAVLLDTGASGVAPTLLVASSSLEGGAPRVTLRRYRCHGGMLTAVR